MDPGLRTTTTCRPEWKLIVSGHEDLNTTGFIHITRSPMTNCVYKGILCKDFIFLLNWLLQLFPDLLLREANSLNLLRREANWEDSITQCFIGHVYRDSDKFTIFILIMSLCILSITFVQGKIVAILKRRKLDHGDSVLWWRTHRIQVNKLELETITPASCCHLSKQTFSSTGSPRFTDCVMKFNIWGLN